MADVKETFEENKKEEPMDVPDSSSSCSTSKDLSKTLPEEAFNNFLHGKRHMLVQDYSYAVQSLATACEMYVSHYGELAIECGEVYFLYGKSLLRLSQQQAGVLGGAINDGSNEDDNSSESEGKENEETEENESEKNSDGEENEDGEKEDGEKEDGEKDEEEKEEKEPSESTDSPPAALDEGSSEAKAKDASKSSDDPGPSQPTEPADSSSNTDDKTAEGSKTEEKSDENKEPEEDLDDLELAWNTLETAKTIFKRQNTVEAELKVAEILQLLAEISMESDNNPGAINDLQESLKIQKKHLKPDDRILAETYYQMGLAQMLEKVYPGALENFRTTKKILELRRENLKNTKVDDADGTFKSADIQLEIADLDTILLDIQEKVDDTLELINNKEKETKESLDEAGSSSILMKDSPEKSTVNKPVSNITHLLKRKKPEEAVTEDGAKRIKTTSVPNGKSKNTETKMTEG